MKTVKDLMTENPACCLRETGLQEVAKMMVDHDCGEIPVVNSMDVKKPIGVITDRDIVCRAVAEGKNSLDLSAQDCMTSSVVTIKEEDSLDDCINLMEENQVRRLPVVSQEGKCVGIIAQADIAKHDESRTGELTRKISRSSVPFHSNKPEEPSQPSIH